jgi:DNA polymerase III epsilon subunit-like protein
MVRRKPTIEHVLPQVIEFLGESDPILLAHNALFDLSFLAMTLVRLGIACPPHDVFDTLDMARRLYPTWPSHSLEHVAMRLNVASRAEHRALSDARLVRDVFLELLLHIPTVNSIADLVRISPLLTFADSAVSAIDLLVGFEALATAMTERCPITIVYEHGWQRPTLRTIMPRLVLQVHGVAYVIAHGHLSGVERTFRLDRIRGCWLE